MKKELANTKDLANLPQDEEETNLISSFSFRKQESAFNLIPRKQTLK